MADTTKRRVRTAKVSEHGAVVWTGDALEKIGNVFAHRLDGWSNVLTGLGGARDKRLGNSFGNAPRISHQRELLSEMYHGDDLVGRIVDLPSQEMYREWIELTAGTAEGTDPDIGTAIMQAMDALGVRTAFTDCEAWSDLYGGSLLLLGVDDGNDPGDPLNFDSIKSLDWVTVLDRFDVEVNSFYEDPLADKFGMPETYRLVGSAGDAKTSIEEKASFNTIVHESRTIRFDGVRTSRRKRRENNGWGDSVLERYVEVIRDFQAASGGIMHLLQDFSQAVFKIKGLAKALGADKEGLVIKRLQMLDIARSMVRAVPLDADAESFERSGAGVAGMADLYDRMMMRLSAATGIPVTLLFGRSPAGMNATGESDIRLFYDHIAARQETQTRPRLEYLIEVMLNARLGPTGGVEPETWSFTFNPLYQESSKEKAETRKLVAQSDKIYVNLGVVTQDEVASSRYGGDSYSSETILDDEARAKRAAIETTIEALAPIQNEEAKEDAPRYRLNSDEKIAGRICASCSFGSVSAVCKRFDFVWDRGHTCDDWDLFDPIVVLKSAKASRSDAKSVKKRPRRGRNA